MKDKATATDNITVRRSPAPTANERFWQRFWKHFRINGDHAGFEVVVDSRVDVTIIEDLNGLVYRFMFRDVDTE